MLEASMPFHKESVMRDIVSLCQRPIPDLSSAKELRAHSRSHPIDLNHPLSSEKLVDIREFGIAGENYYHKDGDNPPYNERIPGSIRHLLLRTSVARRLLVVNERLRKENLELFVHDAYRPVEVQDTFFFEWMPNDVRKRHPDWSDDRVLEEVCKFWGRGSDGNGKVNLLSPPFHSTGGAVDCTLRDRNSKLFIPFGSGFDDFHETERSYTDHFESLKKNGRILTLDEEVALGNRRILYWALTEESFVNNPNEIWHFGLYDQLWAALRKEETAFYSVTFVPFLD
jgi:D-alanyl-D-alanine dipeptidase